MRSTARLPADVAKLGMLLGMAAIATFVPLRQVAACDCAVSALPQAIAEADLAIVGTLAGVGISEGEPGMGAVEPVRYTWAVERSSEPINATEIGIVAWPEDGGGCGMSFGDGRWLVMAYQTDAGLETNSCAGNLRLDEAPEEIIEVVDELVPNRVGSGRTDQPASVPVPILIGIGAAVLVGLISLLAFRRGDATA